MNDFYRPGTTLVLTIPTAGAASTACVPVGDFTSVVRVAGSEDVFLRLFTGTAASALASASSADLFLPADKPEYFRVAGAERISIVGNGTAAGFFTITQMTR
jgi:hypothetical protein